SRGSWGSPWLECGGRGCEEGAGPRPPRTQHSGLDDLHVGEPGFGVIPGEDVHAVPGAAVDQPVAVHVAHGEDTLVAQVCADALGVGPLWALGVLEMPVRVGLLAGDGREQILAIDEGDRATVHTDGDELRAGVAVSEGDNQAGVRLVV